MIQLAWRFLRFQEGTALAQWFQTRTADGRGGTRKTMIIALARKLLVALWRLVTTGDCPASGFITKGGSDNSTTVLAAI
jgi:transposase